MTTTAAEFLKAADPAAALKALSDDVRAKPSDSRHRVFMAQLLCVLGQWERALNQLTVAAELDALAVPMKQMYGDAVRCEGLRADVFAGKRTPMIFGQPDEWLALLIKSLLRQGRGESELAEDRRQRAFDGAPAIGGTIEEAHDPFYEQELGAHGLLSRQSLNLAGAHRPGVEIDGFAPRCATQKAWVDIVRAGLGRGDDMTRAPQGGQQPQRHQGFSRARARRGDDQPPSQRRVSSPR